MRIKFLIVVALIAHWVILGALLFATPTLAQGCDYWVAPPPEGSDTNPGTFAQPWATLEYASAHVPDTACTVWFKDGLYPTANSLHERFANPTTFRAFNPYKAIFEYSGTVLKLIGVRNMIFEGFEFRHSGPGVDPVVVYTSRSDSLNLWAEKITFRNNIFHDSYNNDLLKIHNGSRFITVENNIFYNQEGPDQHVDVNSVTDVTIQDNIFFNAFGLSGRSVPTDTKAYIVIKDSNDNTDGLEGSERIAVRRNIFLNWEGGTGETFLQVGNDGKPYYEAKGVRIENNLMIGNAPNNIGAAFGVSGARDVSFVNNTVVGDLPSSAYAFRVITKTLNLQNQNIYFYNNIWSDATGTMGADVFGNANEFSDGDPSQTSNLILDNNLYWNGGAGIPAGELVSPLVDDAHRVVGDARLNTDQASVVLPRWNGTAFLSGNATIRQEFVRLVDQYGKIPVHSPAIAKANPAFVPSDDILGRNRVGKPDVGAYEHYLTLVGHSGLTTILLNWLDADVPGATSLAITYTVGTNSIQVTGILVTARAYTLTGLLPYSIYTIVLTARDANNAILAQSNTLVLMTTDKHIYLPFVLR